MEGQKFYIVRNMHSDPKQDWLYAMCDTLADAFQVITSDKLQDAAVQCCRGSFPFDYRVTRTFKHMPKKRS